MKLFFLKKKPCAMLPSSTLKGGFTHRCSYSIREMSTK